MYPHDANNSRRIVSILCRIVSYLKIFCNLVSPLVVLYKGGSKPLYTKKETDRSISFHIHESFVSLG